LADRILSSFLTFFSCDTSTFFYHLARSFFRKAFRSLLSSREVPLRQPKEGLPFDVDSPPFPGEVLLVGPLLFFAHFSANVLFSWFSFFFSICPKFFYGFLRVESLSPQSIEFPPRDLWPVISSPSRKEFFFAVANNFPPPGVPRFYQIRFPRLQVSPSSFDFSFVREVQVSPWPAEYPPLFMFPGSLLVLPLWGTFPTLFPEQFF